MNRRFRGIGGYKSMNMILLKCRESVENKNIQVESFCWGDEESKQDVNYTKYIKIYKDKSRMEYLGDVPYYSFLDVSALIQREEKVVEAKKTYYDSYYCPVCEDYVEPDSNYCPHCGSVLGWKILNY